MHLLLWKMNRVSLEECLLMKMVIEYIKYQCRIPVNI
nr:MAG TPA: hypothetical protein [Caudoviricetes sp.]